MSEVEIANVVGTITFRQELDLSELADAFRDTTNINDVKYSPGENHWLQTWFSPDNTYVAFYRSGKASIVGAESIDHLYEISGRVDTVMRDLLEYEYEPAVDIRNIVVTKDMARSITLERLAITLGLETVEYEPEQFPGLVYRGDDHVLLVFSSGQLLCTGLATVEEATDAINWMVEKIQMVV